MVRTGSNALIYLVEAFSDATADGRLGSSIMGAGKSPRRILNIVH